MEGESRDTLLALAMRQNTGIARPVRPDLTVKPDELVGQGPKPKRRCASRQPGGLPPRRGTGRSIHRTAVYGPIRTVVWEGRGREAPPYPYCAEHDRELGGGSPLPSLMTAKG